MDKLKVDTIYGIYLLTFHRKEKYMHFDFDAYGKVFPPAAAAPTVETVVETFKPTEEMAKDGKPGDVAEKAVEIPGEAPEAETPSIAGEPPEGEENGKCNTDLSAG